MEYIAAAGENDAKVVARVSPGASAIIKINLDMADPGTGQKVNFSLTDGDTLSFQIKKTAYGTAEIVAKEGVDLTSGQYDFELVVNEFENAPANSSQIDIEVNVVIDNKAPVFDANAPTTGTVPEREQDFTIATFSASDVNHQVLKYDIVAKVDEETGVVDPGAAQILPSLVIGTYTGVLKTKDEVSDQPDYDEPSVDDPDTDADESARETDNEHVFTIIVSDGTSSETHDFTLTVTDVPEPVRGEALNFEVPENQAGGEGNPFNKFKLAGATGNYIITEEIDGTGVRRAGSSSLFAVKSNDDDASEADIYLRRAGTVDFEDPDISNNYTLAVMADGADADLITIMIVDVNEKPLFSQDDLDLVDEVSSSVELFVLESSAVNDIVKIGQDAGGNPSIEDATFTATDEDGAAAWSEINYDLWWDHDGDPETDTVLYAGADALVKVDLTGDGTVKVASMLDTDGINSVNQVNVVLRAFDPGDPMGLHSALALQVNIIDTNVAPEFDQPSRDQVHTQISESAAIGTPILNPYYAEDEDGDIVKYRLRDQDDTGIFAIGELDGVLTLAAVLNYEVAQSHTVEIQAYDTDGDTDEVVLTVDVLNANDNSPAFNATPRTTLSVNENTGRGHTLANYAATDADGDDVHYSLEGADADSFMISTTGALKTLESLDYDSNTPCGSSDCTVIVVASDMPGAASGAPVVGRHTGPAKATVTITVEPTEDSVSTIKVRKANPVPGTNKGDPDTALSGTKVTASDKDAEFDGMNLPQSPPHERPDGLPATSGDNGPVNFVETEWANWGTVLLIEVTSESPGPATGSGACAYGNQCVVLTIKSDSADDELRVAAYRSATDEDKFLAAIRLVELQKDASTYALDDDGKEVKTPIYQHVRDGVAVKGGGVPALRVDEEDEIEVEFGNLRSSLDVENDAPEITNFSPEHERAFDDADVEYTFSVTDAHSGLPEAEDLPDRDGDEDYMPVVALISGEQCVARDDDDNSTETKALRKSHNAALDILENETLYCPGEKQGGAEGGEYVASDDSTWGFWNIRDDKDFDEIDDGYDVETTVVLLPDKRAYYVTFIACDNAGNCTYFDPDGNDDDAELAEITVDTKEPEFVQARTGVNWNDTDNEYKQNRSFVQLIFDDLTQLNTETVEIDDFVIEGHTIKAIYTYDNPDEEDVDWGANEGDSWSDNVDKAGTNNLRDVARYRDLENTVFVELEDDLLADETPDVTIVPNGVEDVAGNEQDDGDHEADDWITPEFTIVSIIAPNTPEGASNQLAGDGDQVTVTVTADERLDQTRPDVEVFFVDAARVETKGGEECDDGKRKRGEIIENTNGKTSDKCLDNDLATGKELNNNIVKVSNTEWVVTIVKPKETGYYNFYITGKDRSPQKNKGSEGVGTGDIVKDFFDSDGDVNTDDAVFWEADINLPKPNIRVSGEMVTDNEPNVEYRSPLFVEIDFTRNYQSGTDCDDVDSDVRMSDCTNENSEYAEDSFDDVVIKMFRLDGVDMTDSVRTTDAQTFLVSLQSISVGDHTVEIQAVDQAGNELEEILEIDFEVSDRDPFEKRLSPGWNLVSLPGEPADNRIATVFGPDVEVRTVYSYNPVIPGGWLVAVRETLDSDWQGDLTEISAMRGYWVLSDAIQDWEVNIPRLAGGAAGTGTPIQPPVIPLYAGWNLIPVIDIRGDGGDNDTISAIVYLESLGDGLDLARVLGYNTIMNQWETVLDPAPGMMMRNTDLGIGEGYWVFVREAASLVPSGYIAGGSD